MNDNAKSWRGYTFKEFRLANPLYTKQKAWELFQALLNLPL